MTATFLMSFAVNAIFDFPLYQAVFHRCPITLYYIFRSVSRPKSKFVDFSSVGVFKGKNN